MYIYNSNYITLSNIYIYKLCVFPRNIILIYLLLRNSPSMSIIRNVEYILLFKKLNYFNYINNNKY